MPTAQRAETLTAEPTPSPPGRTTWVERSLGSRELIAASVIFPATRAALLPRPLGWFRSVALLRLVDGTVWLLSMPSRAWTGARLDTAAELLGAGAADPEPIKELAQRLRSGLDLPDLTVATPRLDAIDTAQWGLPETARSVVARATDLPSAAKRAAEPKGRLRTAESAMHAVLSDALAAFVAGLDTEALAAASANGAIDVLQYNYLAYRPRRSYRLQFAAAFPNLLPAAATAASGTLGRDVRAAVDSGRPLVKTLARDWGVRPGVVRGLMALRPGIIGEHWMGDIRTLALLLDALRPDDVPGSDPSQWRGFKSAFWVASDLFHEPVQHSPAARKWLRDCVGQLRRGSPEVRARWLPSTDAVDRIRRFRAVLTETLRRDVGAGNVAAEQAVSAHLARAVDRLLADLAPRGLTDTAAAFEAERERAGRGMITDRGTRRIASGRMLLPLIPRDFVAWDGTRVIRALTTEAELAHHGKALDICLGGQQRFQYLALCSRGTRFIVGIFDAATGAPLSTADIALDKFTATGAYLLKLNQHTGRGNSEPSLACQHAVAELLDYCHGLEVRRHLGHGWRLLRRGARATLAELCAEADAQSHAADRAALRTTLGAQLYDELVADARQARRRQAGHD